MSTDKEMSSDVQPEKKWRMFGRRQKLSNCESRAAPQEGEEHRDCRAASVARAAAAGSRAAPHSPRGRGQALLRSLRRGCRAIVSGMAAVIRRRGQQPGTRRPLRRGTGTGTAAAAAPALGPERRAAAPHSPCCPPSPEPGQLEALGGQGAGAAAGAALRQPEVEEQAFSMADWEVDSPEELSEEEDGTGPSQSGEEDRPPLRPREAWAEHGELQPCTGTGQAPALPSRAPHRGEEASNPDPLKDQCPPSPSLSQLGDLPWQGAGAEAEPCPSEAPAEEASSPDELRSVCSLPGLGTAWAEISHLSWSIEESSSGSLLGGSWAEDTKVGSRTGEEKGSGSLLFEAWAEDTDLSGSTDEDSGSVSLPSDLWSQSSDPAWRPEDESSSGSLPWDSPDGTWGQQLLEWDRQSFERLKRLCPPVAVPERRPSHFRRALRALRRAFGSLGRFNPVLQP